MESSPQIKSAPNTEGWHFFVPQAFSRAIERISGARADSIITASVFNRGDTFYDTPLAYQVWREALRHIRRAIVVEGDTAGLIAFRFHEVKNGSLVPTDPFHKLTALSFLQLLRTGQIPSSKQHG